MIVTQTTPGWPTQADKTLFASENVMIVAHQLTLVPYERTEGLMPQQRFIQSISVFSYITYPGFKSD